MKLNKKKLYKIHSWIGLKLSILFFIVCFSGTLATLSHEMDWLFFPEERANIQENKASYKDHLENIKRQYPKGKIGYWPSSKEPYLCDFVQLHINDQRHFIFVNQYTGEVQGSTTLTFQRFFRDFHYYLFIPFQVGHFAVLMFGFMLFLSTITAILFYKNWWRKLFKLNIGKGKVAFYKSLHKLVGSWSIPFAILFSVTGIWYFVERVNLGGVHSMAVNERPEITPLEMKDFIFSKLSYHIDYDKTVKIAEQALPGLSVLDIIPPENQKKAIYLTGINDVPLVRNRANQVFLHPITYDVIKVKDAHKAGTITWLNDIVDPLHFGNWGGLLTKLIWFIAGLAISSLVLSGIWTMLKRKVRSKKTANAKNKNFWKYYNWVITGLMFVSMHIIFITFYVAPIRIHIIVTLAFAIFLFIGWYVFVYRLNLRPDEQKRSKS